MYPPYWTTSKEGIFMSYSHEYELECIKSYTGKEFGLKHQKEQ